MRNFTLAMETAESQLNELCLKRKLRSYLYKRDSSSTNVKTGLNTGTVHTVDRSVMTSHVIDALCGDLIFSFKWFSFRVVCAGSNFA